MVAGTRKKGPPAGVASGPFGCPVLLGQRWVNQASRSWAVGISAIVLDTSVAHNSTAGSTRTLTSTEWSYGCSLSEVSMDILLRRDGVMGRRDP